MALLNAEAHLQGEAETLATPFVISGGLSVMSGQSTFTVIPQVEHHATLALQGNSSVTGDMIYLLYADLVGDASVGADAVFDIAASSDIEAGSDLEVASTVDYGAEALVVAEASVTASSVMTYGALAPIQGDAQVTARALPDDEIAIDLRGGSQVESVAVTEYQVLSGVQGGSAITAVALLRHPIVPATAPEPVEDERLVGYQPGREPAEGTESFTVIVPK